MAIELWRTRPYTIGSLSQAMDRLFDQAFSPMYQTSANGGSTSVQSLPVNVWETNESYQVAMLAPGLDEQSLNVTVHEDTLTVEGEMHFQTPEAARTIWQQFGPAKVRRQLRLNAPVNPSNVEAIYRNGLLLVTLPKAEHARPRQVPVQVNTPNPEPAHS